MAERGGVVFVSHASADREVTQGFVEPLRAAGYEDIFFTSEPAHGIPPGEEWEPSLYQHLRRAAAVLFVLTPASAASKWCFSELVLARALGKPILTIDASTERVDHPLTDARQRMKVDQDLTRRLCNWLSQHVELSGKWEVGRCPYPGFDRFTSEYEPVFYGREENIEELIAVFTPLRRTDRARRVVAVSGPSGSGKSSFVLAGLVPQLQRLPDWQVLPAFVPGANPVRNLATAVAAAIAGADEAEVEAKLRGEEGLALLCGLTEGGRQLVIVVDQFEELVTLCAEGARRPFLALLDRVAQGSSGVWVIATARTEFLSREGTPNDVAQFLSARAVNYLLLPVGRNGEVLRQIVTGPAAKAGADVEAELEDAIVEDVVSGDVSGASLPLVALALRETWEQMERRVGGTTAARVLSLEDYDASGRVGGVVAGLAGAAARRLELEGCQDAVLPTLARLVVPIRQGERPARRRLPVSAVTGCAERVAREFQEARLLRVVEADGGPAYDVTHEALFEQWIDLRDYIATHWQALQDVSELERRARQWKLSGDAGDLARGALLQRTVELAASMDDELLREYLRMSIDADQESQRRLLREKVEADAGKALDTLAASPLQALELVCRAADAWGDSGPAPPARLQEALYEVVCTARQTRVATGHTSSVRALAVSVPAGLVATGGDDRRVLLWAEGESAPRSALEGHRAGINALAFSPSGAQLASAAGDGIVLVWSVDTGAKREIDVTPDVVTALAFSPDGAVLASVGECGMLRLWDVSNLSTVGSVQAHDEYATACCFHPSGEHLYTAGADGSVAQWGLPGCTQSGRVAAHQGPAFALAVDPGGERVASGGMDGVVRLWTVDLAPLPGPFQGHTRYISALTFTASGRSIVSAGGNGLLRQWDLDGYQSEPPLVGHSGAVCDVAMGCGARELVSCGVDGTTRWWDGSGHLLADPISGFPEPVNVVAAPGQERILLAFDHHIRCFSPEGHQLGPPWEAHETYVHTLAVSPAGDAVASGSADGRIVLWDIHGGVRVPPFEAHAADVNKVVFTPDGSGLISAGMDGAVRLWRRDGSGAVDPIALLASPVRVVDVFDGNAGPVAVTGGNDGRLRLWALDGMSLGECMAHEGSVHYVVVARDGGRIFSVGERGDLRAWNLDLTEAVGGVTAHSGPIAMVARGPDQLLITAGADGEVRRWNPDLTPFGRSLPAHRGGAWTVACDPAGSKLITGGDDSAVRVWRSGSWPEWLAVAHDRRQRLALGTTIAAG